MDEETLVRLDALEKQVGWLMAGARPVWLTTPITVYNATTFSTVGSSTEITAATMGTPAAAKALLVYITAKDTGGAPYEFSIGPNSTYYYALKVISQVTNQLNVIDGLCPTDANGSVWYRCTASGAGTLQVTMRIWGYFL